MAQMNPLGTPGGHHSGSISYDGTNKTFKINNYQEILHSNKFFTRKQINSYQYSRYAAYGFLDPYNNESTREILFFTKPDLKFFKSGYYKYDSAITDNLLEELQSIPFFVDAVERHRDTLLQLQYSMHGCPENIRNSKTPFMYLLSNRVTSKLELPGIASENQESTSNLFGDNIAYRSNSWKSDYGYDFTLSFTDTNTLEIYYLVKIYDEYMRLYRTGEISAYQDYVVNHILPEQFSIYKFIIGEDGETILYYAKLTGVYFTDVPRSDFGDPETPFKFSLGFHAQYVEDNNPIILSEFNVVAGTSAVPNDTDITNHTAFPIIKEGVHNDFFVNPHIFSREDTRATAKPTKKDYRLIWLA